MRMKFWWVLWGCLAGWTGVQAQALSAPAATPSAGVVVVLAGGGAKGFAHLAVLRQLEQDRVPIARIVGTSMGAVIGSLYASGMRTADIEKVIGELDPAKVALDQVDRLELPPSARAYQQQYPINLEFGIRDGRLSFARGASDGQRFTALLQRLFAHLPAEIDFNDLKIPLRVVATRYRDGEARVFDRGALHMAVRASMAAPGVFAPVEIDGETYVDGGLVANLPVEVALQEGAGQIVASYLGKGQEQAEEVRSDNALVVANHMISLLLQQNERRNLALLRPHDVLVRPELTGVGFADFNRAAEIVGRGEQALHAVAPAWQAMVQRQARPAPEVAERPRLAFDQREVRIAEVRVSGQAHVSPEFVQSRMADLKGQVFDAAEVEQRIDQLYTSGYFEQVSYALEQLQGERYALGVQVHEKPYAPHFFKTTMGFSTEMDGVTQFSFGAGYRRPWLTPQGLELQLDARLGTLSEFGTRLIQPLGQSWAVEAGLNWRSNQIPVYEPEAWSPGSKPRKFAYMRDVREELYASVNHDFGRHSVMKLGVVQAAQRYQVDVTRTLINPDDLTDNISLSDLNFNYTALRWRWDVDQLDSVSFPTHGHALGLSLESGLSGARYSRSRARMLWAQSWGPHVLNLGANWARDKVPNNCAVNCAQPTFLYLGGFQFMGAYRMGQLSGDQLAHAHATYMYRLSDGGLLRQKSFVGLVGEVGDAWDQNASFHGRRSLTVFLGMDSFIGDLYIGAARGSDGASNVFLQLGRRFQF